ncbi:DUF2868 domain-containing protein [Planctomycetota bacterium]|nr:DUF2868 domain-containing protein [Planctomycetota bacterium]
MNEHTQQYSPHHLAALIDLQSQLSHENNLTDKEKLTRDLPLAQSLTTTNKTSRILTWLAHVTPTPTRTAQYIFLLSALITTLGLLLGLTLSKAVYHYTGSAPINIITPIAVFMFAQLLLTLLTIIAMLPSSLTKHIPLITSFQDSIIALNPGHLLYLFLKLIPSKQQTNMTALLSDLKSTQTTFASLQKWTILRYAQSFSLAINIAAILTFIYLLTFSDLAFAWSTTLNLNQQSIASLTQTIATPFAFIPDTSPTTELIQNTQFFRGNAADFDPKLARDWWPFLLALMITYSFIPRLLLYITASQIHRRVIKNTITNLPAAISLLTRLDHLQSAPQNPQVQDTTPTAKPPNQPLDPQPQSAQTTSLLIVDQTPIPTNFPYTPTQSANFAGTQTIEQDAQALDLITNNLSTDAQLIILVKLWEPPTQEILDLLTTLRSNLNKQTPILITPTPTDEHNNTVTNNPEHLHHWTLKVRSLADPYTLINPILTNQQPN